MRALAPQAREKTSQAPGIGTLNLPLSALYPARFIKSERSIILLNFCVSILASNVLILVGQSQMLSKVRALPGHQVLISLPLLLFQLPGPCQGTGQRAGWAPAIQLDIWE